MNSKVVISRYSFIALIAVTVAVGFSVAMLGTSDTRQASAGQVDYTDLAILRQPMQAAKDTLPAGVPVKMVPDPSSARLAFERGQNAYWVAPGENGRTCVVAKEHEGISANCAQRGSANQSGSVLALGEPSTTSDALRVVAVVPDGYVTATSSQGVFPLTNNVVVVDLGPGENSFTLRGRAGRKIVPVGWLRPKMSVAERLEKRAEQLSAR